MASRTANRAKPLSATKVLRKLLEIPSERLRVALDGGDPIYAVYAVRKSKRSAPVLIVREAPAEDPELQFADELEEPVQLHEEDDGSLVLTSQRVAAVGMQDINALYRDAYHAFLSETRTRGLEFDRVEVVVSIRGFRSA